MRIEEIFVLATSARRPPPNMAGVARVTVAARAGGHGARATATTGVAGAIRLARTTGTTGMTGAAAQHHYWQGW